VFTPAHPRQLDPTGLEVHLTDASGKPVSGAIITASLTMPTMDMGRNQVALSGAGGAYKGAGRFTMSGSWLVTITARQGGDTLRQSFPVDVQ